LHTDFLLLNRDARQKFREFRRQLLEIVNRQKIREDWFDKILRLLVEPGTRQAHVEIFTLAELQLRDQLCEIAAADKFECAK